MLFIERAYVSIPPSQEGKCRRMQIIPVAVCLILLSSPGRRSGYRGDEPGHRQHRHHLGDQHGEACSCNLQPSQRRD